MATNDNRALKKAMVALYKLYNNVRAVWESTLLFPKPLDPRYDTESSYFKCFFNRAVPHRRIVLRCRASFIKQRSAAVLFLHGSYVYGRRSSSGAVAVIVLPVDRK